MRLVEYLPISVRLRVAKARRLSKWSDILGRYGSGALWAHLAPSVTSNLWRQVRLGRDCQIGRGTTLHTNDTATVVRIAVGRRSFIGERCFVSAGERVDIGDDCLVGAACSLLGAGHEFGDPTSAYAAAPVRSYGPLILLPNVWLGTAVTVVGGLTIGFGTVVAAGSVVRSSLPALCLAAGQPARPIKVFDWKSKSWTRLSADEQAAVAQLRSHIESLPSMSDFMSEMAARRSSS